MTAGDLERLADLIADRLTDRPPAPPRIVGAADLAAIFGVSRDAIYEHADDLGALRIGGALRFDVADAIERARTTATPPPAPPAVTTRRRRSRTAVELLPIRTERTR